MSDSARNICLQTFQQACQRFFDQSVPDQAKSHLRQFLDAFSAATVAPDGSVRIAVPNSSSSSNNSHGNQGDAIAELLVGSGFSATGLMRFPLDLPLYRQAMNTARAEAHAAGEKARLAHLQTLVEQSSFDEDITLAERIREMDRFCRQFESHIAAFPFVLGLSQFLYMQAHTSTNSVQWILDDAVLAEGGADLASAAVRMLVGVLGCQASTRLPNGLRTWTLSTALTGAEIARIEMRVFWSAARQKARAGAQMTGTLQHTERPLQLQLTRTLIQKLADWWWLSVSFVSHLIAR